MYHSRDEDSSLIAAANFSPTYKYALNDVPSMRTLGRSMEFIVTSTIANKSEAAAAGRPRARASVRRADIRL